MTAVFDPYHRWLGIAADEQPPHHYRLLGLKLLEEDADVIESAADRQMAHVRTFQGGPHAADAQRLLNEISAARVLLLHAEKKAVYDAQLKAKLDQLKKKRKQERPLPVAQPLSTTGSGVFSDSTVHGAAAAPHVGKDIRPQRRGVPTTVVYALIAGGVALLLMGGVIAIVLQPWKSPPEVAGAGGTNIATNNTSDNATEAGTTTNAVTPTEFQSNDPDDKLQLPPPPISTANDGGDDDATTTADPPTVDPAPIDPPEDNIDDPPTTEVALGPPPPSEPQKEPVPDKAARDAARKKIADVLPVNDANTLQEKAALAAQLLSIARETKDDPTARFVLLNLAREQAAAAAKVRMAFEAIDLLEAEYDFDVAPVRLATLGEGVRSSLPPTEKREVIVVGIEMMDAMMLRDEYAAADKLVDPLLDLARRAKDKQLTDAVAERRRRAGELAAAYKLAKSAIETLNSDPDNAAANLAAGRYYLFAKGDWQRALPLLAKVDDAQLAKAAQGEIGVPQTPDQKEQLAHAWWAAAQAEKDELGKNIYRVRAGMWYREVVGSLVGLAKVQAEKRIAEAAAIAVDAGSKLAPPLPVNLLETVDLSRDTNDGPWTQEDAAMRCKGGGLLTIPVRIDASNYDVAIQFTRSGASFVGFLLPVRDTYVTALLSVRYSASRPSKAGFADIDGNNLWQNATRVDHPKIDDGKPHQVLCRVITKGDKAHLELWLDGKALSSWDGPISALSAGRVVASNAKTAPAEPGHLALHVTDGDTIYHSVGLRVNEGAVMLDLAATTASPPNSTEPDLGIFSRDPRELQPPPASENGLVAHWTFDEGQGDVARDAVGSHDGKIKRGTWTEGVHGKALHFDKQGGYVSIPGSPEFDEASRSSIAVWIKSDDALESGMENVVTHLISGSTWEELRLVCFDDGDGASYLGGFSKRGGGADKAMSRIPREDKAAWVHLAMTHDGKAWRLFRNGVQVAQADSTLARFSFKGQWLIGGFADGRRYFHGDIDDVRIYNRALSAEEVAALASPPDDHPPPKVAAVPADGLHAHWNFDEGRGAVAGDSVGGQDGTIKGATWVEGVHGKALRFDGRASRVDLGEHEALNFGGEMTMSAWVRPARMPQGITFMNVLAHVHPTEPKEIYLRLNGGQYSVGCYTGRHIATERGAPRGDVGAWVHLAGVYDGESWHVYRNGEPLVSHKTDAGPLAFDGPWAIGASPNAQERMFEGDIDDVRIYNRALSAEEVQALSLAK